jgi:hypothetical protein
MARKTRKSKLTDTAATVAAMATGLGVGALGVPRLVEMIDPEGKFNPQVINGVGAIGFGYLGSTQDGLVKTGLYSLAAGMLWNAASPMIGIGYGVTDNSTDFLNRVAGAGDSYRPSRPNPGDV